MGIGITGIEVYIPPTRLSAEDMHCRYGVSLDYLREKMRLKEKPICIAQHPSEIAFEAARKLIHENDIDPLSIDLLVYCGSGISDYQFWSPAAKIQSLIAAKNSFCFEITNACNAANTGLSVCRSLIQANVQYKNALVVMSDTLSQMVDHADPTLTSLLNFADAASAVFIQTNQDRLNILSSHFQTDSTFVDWYWMEKGGTCSKAMEHPKSCISYQAPSATTHNLHEAYLANLEAVILTALKEARLTQDDIDYLFINQGDHRVVNELLAIFNLDETNSLLTYEEFGHLGATDTLMALKHGLTEDRFKTGDVIVLASSGIGFSWGASVLRY